MLNPTVSADIDCKAVRRFPGLDPDIAGEGGWKMGACWAGQAGALHRKVEKRTLHVAPKPPYADIPCPLPLRLHPEWPGSA